MKTATQFFSLMIALFIISVSGNAQAQGRGHHNPHERSHGGHYEGKDHGHDLKHEHHKHHDRHEHHAHRHGDRHVVHPTIRHHHEKPVVVRHYHKRPRYIYYQDYNVYYDLHRNVYISYSGRNWSLSASLPVALHRVDMRRAVRMEVDYYQDDFPRYLERDRPAFRGEYIAY